MIEMHCTTCKPIVEKQLMDEEQWKKIAIDYMTDGIIIRI